MYKINRLLKQDQKLFHTADLALLWGITNKNSLYTTIKRYCQKGILIPIHKGYYSTVSLNEIDSVRLAVGYLHCYAYVSCETVLIKHGIIFQQSNYLTLVSSISKKFIINNQEILVRKLNDKFLLNDYGISRENDVVIAGIERAVADMLYFNHRYHFDNQLKINWKKVRQVQKEVGYQ